jgi:DcmR-like sensory protein
MLALCGRMASFETVVHGHVASRHVMQLFDTEVSRCDAVSAFVRAGLDSGENAVVVITAPRWFAVAEHLRACGVDLEAAFASGHLTLRDASSALGLFMNAQSPHARLFELSMGALVSQLWGNGRALRIYGEMVDVLAERGDLAAALQLEALWNRLAEQLPFTLFCGYSAVHFGDARAGAMLESICRSHNVVQSDPRDLLGAFLVREAGARIHYADT